MATNNNSNTVVYDVLYYKRVAAAKVHRDKGVSKFDGVLTVMRPSGSASGTAAATATLTSAAEEENPKEEESSSEDDEDEIAKLSWNEKRKRRQMKGPSNKKHKTKGTSSSSHALYTGRLMLDSESLPEETVLVLGGYQVQIVARRRSNNSSNNQAATAILPPPSTRKPLLLPTRTVLISRKKKPLLHNHSTQKKVTPPNNVGATTAATTGRTLAPVGLKPAAAAAPQPTLPAPLPSNHHHGTIQPKTVMTTTKLVSKKRPLLVSKGSSSSSLGANTNKQQQPRRRPLLHAAPNAAMTAAASTSTTKPQATSAVTTSTTGGGCLPHIPMPASIRQVLRPHQITGVDFLYRMVTGEKRGCILGDEMGLGKTLMTIACITALHRRQRDKQFVVVCPSTLVKNWANEADKWLGRASQPKRVVIHKGGEEGLRQIRAYTSSMKQALKNHTGQVLIVSYELFRRHSNQFVFPEHTSVGLLVVDEGHRLKSSSGSLTLSALESLPADARLCITATPIQNNLKEFHALANFCCPGILGDAASFRKDFERPIAAANQKNATREQLVMGHAKSKELETLSKTFMLRRLQKDVLKSMLPPRTEALLFCRPSPRQCELYRQLTKKQTGAVGTDALALLTALRKICSHPFLYDEEAAPAATTSNSTDTTASSLSLSGKLVVLDALLQQIRQQCPGDKVVIVSNFTSALSLIETLVLQPHNWAYSRLDGTTNTEHRQDLVDTFNRASSPDRAFCFLLSSKAGGCGLNLVGANKLVMFDADWNPSTDVQAMGRVYRQGQTKPCTIYRLFCSGTLEEIVYQRQWQKGGLATLTVDAATNNSTDKRGKSKKTGVTTNKAMFSQEELRDCFTLKTDCVCDTKQKLGPRWPDYDGPAALRLSGSCTDEPLLAVAESLPDTLCFVHLVNGDDEDDTTVVATNDDDECSSSSSQDDDEAEQDEEEKSSDSENEFD